MRREYYIRQLEHVLGEEVVSAMTIARISLSRISEMAAIKTFMDLKTETVEAHTIRYQLRELERHGAFNFREDA